MASFYPTRSDYKLMGYQEAQFGFSKGVPAPLIRRSLPLRTEPEMISKLSTSRVSPYIQKGSPAMLNTAVNSQSLVRFAREGSAAEYAAALKGTGSAVLSNAMEVFCAMDRETENGRAAVDQIKDLKNSLIAHIERNQTETSTNLVGANAVAAKITAGQDPTHKLEAAKVETLKNAPLENRPNRVYDHLRKDWGAETTKVEVPALDGMSGLKKFLADLTAMQGLYTAAVMIPGPLSATVKNVAKELYTSNQRSSSSASGSSQAEGAVLSLLGVGGFGSDSSFSSQSNSSGSARFEKSTIDERVVPVLGELQDRLAQTTVVPATSGAVQGRRHLQEYSGKSTWFGAGKVVFEDRESYTSEYTDTRIKRDFEAFEYQPGHVRIPDTSISDYADKK